MSIFQPYLEHMTLICHIITPVIDFTSVFKKENSVVLVWDEFLFLFHSSTFSKIKYFFHCYIAGSFPLQLVHSLASSWSHDMLQWNCLPPNDISGQHCENYDIKWETVHCYPQNVDHCCMCSRRWRGAVSGISVHFSKFAFVLFYYITNYLMIGPLLNNFPGPLGNNFVLIESRCFLLLHLRKHWDSGNKIQCSPWDQSLSVFCWLPRGVHMKGVGMLVASLRDVNFRFWSRLVCSGKNAIIFSHEVLVKSCMWRNIYICLFSDMVSFRGHKKLGPCPDPSPLGVQCKISNEHPHPFHIRAPSRVDWSIPLITG